MGRVYTKIRKAYYFGKERLSHRAYTGDEFFLWLNFANAGMFDPGNIYSMDVAIKNLPSTNPVVEIGAFCGLSTNVLAYLLAKHGKNNPLITADPWEFEGSEQGGCIGKSSITFAQYKDFVRESYKRNVQFFSRNRPPRAIALNSDDFFAQWDAHATATDVDGAIVELGGGISFAFIDGNHTYEYCKRDFQNVDRHLDAGGWILFDDTSDVDPYGLTRLMREVKSSKKYELVAKNPNYLFTKL